ncbi:hypothetical protein HOM13_02385 [Candidatus Woesearchaeota archaeon]|jgi:hypothetical protein|nr:hypothetical protein [Candidatus Woesearchaeota archaeon]MBT5215563.1 hypothetical protein [Candidatus Woesearchaeota archaeon]MBT6401882.1 hypothetical protein [Candidatus Woesearchaeota archaeon]
MASKKRKGQIWISAVLFISLGVMVISLILAAAIPMVNRISDKNTVIRTKEILLKVDDAIKTVINEGPGSQRQLDPLIIDRGELHITNDTYNIRWLMETKADLMEPEIEIVEGNIKQILNTTIVEEIYEINIWVDSDKFNISLNSPFTSPFKGEYIVTVKHTGEFTPTDNPIIELRVA